MISRCRAAMIILLSASVLVTGCRFSPRYDLAVENEFDVILENVIVTADGIEYGVGVLVPNATKGLMNAHSVFGHPIPDVWVVDFEIGDSREVVSVTINSSQLDRDGEMILIRLTPSQRNDNDADGQK